MSPALIFGARGASPNPAYPESNFESFESDRLAPLSPQSPSDLSLRPRRNPDWAKREKGWLKTRYHEDGTSKRTLEEDSGGGLHRRTIVVVVVVISAQTFLPIELLPPPPFSINLETFLSSSRSSKLAKARRGVREERFFRFLREDKVYY